MSRKLVILSLGLLLAIYGTYIAFAEAAYEEVALIGDTGDDGMYNGEISVEYTLSDAENIEEVQLLLGGKKVAVKECKAIENDAGISIATDTQQLTEEILAENEPEGYEYALTVRAVDKDGEFTDRNISFKADVSVPVISISGAENNGKYKEKTHVKVAVSDKNIENATFSVSVMKDNIEILQKNDLAASAETFTFEAAINGAYTIEATAYDKGQNRISQSLTFLIDRNGPVIEKALVTGSHNTGSEWFNADGDIRLSAEITEALTSLKWIKVYVNDQLVEALDYSDKDDSIRKKSLEKNLSEKWFAEHESIDGKYAYRIVVSDTLGNETEAAGSFLADMKPPSLYVTGIRDGACLNSAPAIEVEGEDNYKGSSIFISVYKDGKEFDQIVKTDSAAFSYTNFEEDGFYEIEAYSQDAAGNRSNVVKISFIRDSVSPVIKSGSDTIMIEGHRKDEGKWFDDSVQIKTEIIDPLSKIRSVFVKVNGITILEAEELAEESHEIDISDILSKEWFQRNESRDGKYEVEVTAVDMAGNQITEKKAFYADVTTPKCIVSGAENGSFIKAAPTIEGTVFDNYNNENTLTMIILKDGEEIEVVKAQSASVSYDKFDEDASYTIKIVAEDPAGNMSQEEVLQFTKDAKAPSITGGRDEIDINGHVKEAGMWFDDSVQIKTGLRDETSLLSNALVTVNGIKVFEKENIDGESITVDTKEVISKDWFKKHESETGSYEVRITAEDRAGNIITKTAVFYADVTAPALTLSGIEAGTFTSESPEVSAVVTDNYQRHNTIHYDITRDGSAFYNKETEADAFGYDRFDQDGDFVVTAFAVDKAGNSSPTEKLAFTKDTVAPVLSITGAREGSFSNEAKTVNAQITERNYSTADIHLQMIKSLDGKEERIESGSIKATAYEHVHSKKVGNTGTYTVSLSAEDAAGNKAKPKTLEFTIDNEKPVIEISRVSKENGYNALVAPKITYEDSYFESREITLSRADGKEGEISFRDYENVKGGTRAYLDFSKVASNDGTYTLFCRVRDKAGNVETESVTFAVNRFGSVYELDEKSKGLKGSYSRQLSDNIKITEKNVTGLSEYETSITKDGVKRSVDVEALSGTDQGWKTYTYSFNKNLFSDEGAYELNVSSKDSMGNFSEYADGNDRYKFYIDKTAPVVSIAGIEEGGSYKGADSAITVNVKDAIKLSEYIVSSDGKILYDSKAEKNLPERKEIILPAGVNQSVEVVAADAAGNTETVRVDDVTVSDNFFVRLWSNKALVACVLAAFAVICCGGFLLYWKKRKPQE